MEIKLSAGDKLNIPENCKATIENNQIIIEEQKEFKDGEILSAIDSTIILVFKSYHKNINVFCSYCNNTGWGNEGWNASKFRLATEEEKQKFFAELEAKGLHWNAETKTMERIRKRVKKGGEILIIAAQGGIITSYDDRDIIHDMLWNLGNYYLPNELEKAQEDFKAIRAIFEKRKIENI